MESPTLQKDPFNGKPWPPAESSPLLIQSDLGIKDWLVGALLFDTALPSSPQPSPSWQWWRKNIERWRWRWGRWRWRICSRFIFPEIKFIIISSGNIQPTWKLLPVSANAGNTPFFSMGRTRTHDLLVTIGPPTQRTTNDFLASQIGQAVNSGIRQAATNGAQ